MMLENLGVWNKAWEMASKIRPKERCRIGQALALELQQQN